MKKILLLISLLTLITFNTHSQVYFSEEFASNSLPTGWLNLDQDGDGKKWQFSSESAVSYSWYNNTPLRPNNWLITKPINLTNVTGDVALIYFIAGYHASYPREHYQVRVSTTNNSVASFSTILHDETISQGGTWQFRSHSLNTFRGQTIYIAFVHNDTYDQYALLLDDIMIVGANEIALENITTQTTMRVGEQVMVKGKVRNLGTAPLTSYKISYNLNGGTESSVYTVSGINVASGVAHNFTHNVPLPTTTAGNYTLNVTISSPNGIADQTSNNSGSQQISIYKNAVQRRVLLEHFSTANCSNCPSATNQIKTWLNTRPDVIWLIHHAGYYTDGLTIPASSSLTVFFNDGGSTYAPGIMLDRKWLAPDDDPGPVFSPYSNNPQLIDAERTEPAFVTVNFTNASYNSSTRNLTITISGEIVNTINQNNLRLSFYAKEDNLKTTPAQSGSSLGSNYVHNNAMRAAISNVWGETGVITSGNEGTTYAKTFNYTIPTNFDLNNLSFVAFVSQYNSNVNQRDILNAKAVKMNDIISGNYVNDYTNVEEPQNPTSIQNNPEIPPLLIYPNPANNLIFMQTSLNIEKIDIFNVQGQRIECEQPTTSAISISHLSNGLYLLRITTTEGEVVTQQFIKE